jgi:hypothetical protein
MRDYGLSGLGWHKSQRYMEEGREKKGKPRARGLALRHRPNSKSGGLSGSG